MIMQKYVTNDPETLELMEYDGTLEEAYKICSKYSGMQPCFDFTSGKYADTFGFTGNITYIEQYGGNSREWQIIPGDFVGTSNNSSRLQIVYPSLLDKCYTKVDDESKVRVTTGGTIGDMLG